MNTTAKVFLTKSKGTSLLEGLERHFTQYAALSPGLPLVLALWSIATHLFDSFDVFPYLAITSPTKRCGKTRVAELLECVSANPLRTVGISVAALFRTIEKKKPTLLIDEAESLRGRDEWTSALREILNAGYRRGQKVIRCEGGNGKSYKTREFETFCPKALILIGSLPDTLADRCIPIEMKRRTTETLERFRFGRVNRETKSLVASVGKWARAHRAASKRWYNENDLTWLEGREAELWLPLFAVCIILDPQRTSELEAIAKRLAGAKAESEPGDFGIRVLGDIRTIFGSNRTGRLATNELVSELHAMQESPWPGWSQGRGLDARSLSHLLRPFEIQPKNLRLSATEVAKGYERADFEDAWKRYLYTTAATSATELSFQQDRPDSPPATEPLRSGQQNAENSNVYAGCSGVADEMFPSLAGVAEAFAD